MENRPMSTVYLTTTDNPYNPFSEYDAWYQYDIQKGYYTCGLLSRIAHTSIELSEKDYEIEIEKAIDSIVENNIYGNYIKITQDSFLTREKRKANQLKLLK